jgi:hypothetical protein
MNNNKLIAEFMDLEEAPKGIVNEYNPREYYVKEYNSGVWYLPEEMKYHSSWDWLMPVAKKCINPEVNTEGWDNLAVALTTCNLDEVYQAVVEFIKTYNDVQTLREDAMFQQMDNLPPHVQ